MLSHSSVTFNNSYGHDLLNKNDEPMLGGTNS